MENQQPTSIPQSQISTLPGVGNLLKRSCQVYKERFWQLLGTMILCTLLLLLFTALVVGGVVIFGPRPGLAIVITLVLVSAIGSLIIESLRVASLIFIIKEKERKIGIKEALKLGWSKTLSMAWIIFLAVIVTIGGYLLFIIPGIIFLVWFSFPGYVLVVENIKGTKALSRSKFLVKGYWWSVFWRIFVLLFLTGVIYNVLYFAHELLLYISVILLQPFSVVFSFLLYEDLKRLKESLA